LTCLSVSVTVRIEGKRDKLYSKNLDGKSVENIGRTISFLDITSIDAVGLSAKVVKV